VIYWYSLNTALYHILSLASRVGFVNSMDRWASLQRSKKYLLMGCFACLTLHHALKRESRHEQAAMTLLHHVSSWSRSTIVMIYTFCNGTPHIKLHLLLSSTARSSVRKLSTPICWETMLQVGNHHSLCVFVCVCVCVCVMNERVVGLPNHQPLLGNFGLCTPPFL